jgi:Tetratricopeptide repeat
LADLGRSSEVGGFPIKCSASFTEEHRVTLSRSPTALVWIVGLLVLAATGTARADDAADAKAHYQRATAHFAVGEYREAATEYEEAFKLKQDPAILFNAAQAHRLAGDNQKALLIYNNVIKLYPTSRYATDSKERIEKLAQSGASPPAAVPVVPIVPIAPVVPIAPIAPAASPQPPAAPALGASATPAGATAAGGSSTLLVATPVPPPEPGSKPVYTRWWFWAAAGGVVAIGVIAIVALSSGSAGSWNNVPDVRASLVRW